MYGRTQRLLSLLSYGSDLCQRALARSGRGLFIYLSLMTSANSLSLILRRLDEIERKLDRMMEELRTPTAIGYSARRGNRPRKE
jgi:predicted Co/Zn/Cd cation transporter (cation efflux family)